MEKKVKAIIRVKIGVKELSTPARALSNFNSAKQKRYAGTRLPRVPERNTRNTRDGGITKNAFIPYGANTSPAVTIRKEATWYGLKELSPPFIKMKLLPQIMDKTINSIQLKKRENKDLFRFAAKFSLFR